MRCYNIVLKTSDSVSGNVDEYGGTDTASMTYAFDWSFIPDGDYELSYTFKTDRFEDSALLDFIISTGLKRPGRPYLKNYERVDVPIMSTALES